MAIISTAAYKFFQNSQCEYFPCHKTDDPENFNCLFCYCPLYTLGKRCGGNFNYTSMGVKDCSNCLIPHSEGGFEYIQDAFGKIIVFMDDVERSRNG